MRCILLLYPVSDSCSNPLPFPTNEKNIFHYRNDAGAGDRAGLRMGGISE